MKNIQAYKFVSNDKPKEVLFIIDFLINDSIGAHKYYLINCSDSIEIRKVTSIDKVIEHFDRNEMEYVELSSKQALGVLFSTISHSLNKNDSVKETVFDFPGVAPVNELDIMLLNKNIDGNKVGDDLDESKHGKK